MAQKITLNVIAFYAQHTSCPQAIQSSFWETLRATIELARPRQALDLLGDANALVGTAPSSTASDSFHGALGRHGLPERNDAGLKLLHLCMDHKLYVSNTFFQHRLSRRASYIPTLPHLLNPNNPQAASICNDYIIGRKSFYSSITNVRVYRSLNGLGAPFSDHHPVLAFLQFKFRRQCKGGSTPPTPNFAALAHDEPTLLAYQARLNDLLLQHQPALHHSTSVEATWATLCTVLKTAEDVLPTLSSTHHHFPDPSPELLRLIQESDTLKAKTQPYHRTRSTTSQLKAIRKQIRQEIHVLKTQDAKRVSQSVSHAFRQRDQAAAWKLVKQLSPHRRLSSPHSLHNGNGILQDQPTAQLAMLYDHYSAIYSTQDMPTVDTSGLRTDIVPPPAPTLSFEADFLAAVSSLNNRKAADRNGIRNEHLKYTSAYFHQILFKVAEQAWHHGLPDSSKIFDLVSIPKPGDATDLNNRRSISISSKLYLIISKILAHRLTSDNETRILDIQAGFRLHRGCHEQRTILQLVMDEARQCQKKFYIALVDFSKALIPWTVQLWLPSCSILVLPLTTSELLLTSIPIPK